MKVSSSSMRGGVKAGGGAAARRGMALVITLILLSVITVMAITFLVVSSTERRSVSTLTDQTTARLTADAGQERAKIDLIGAIVAHNTNFSYYAYGSSNIYAFTNNFTSKVTNYCDLLSGLPGLMVSTNYINSFGYVNGVASPTNVNYDYTAQNQPLSALQQQQNIANLFFNPRPPVVMSNTVFRTNELSFYLDLNRNGRFEDTGLLPVVGPDGRYYQTNGVLNSAITASTLSNYVVGDPQWIGLLERPGFPHSPSNYFIGRYAYVVIPSSLDVNYIHNDYNQIDPATAGANDEGFRRNQGLGTYEINLAAFLADLNTNYWGQGTYGTNGLGYHFDPINLYPCNGAAFDDAMAILRYRYGSSLSTLASLQTTLDPYNWIPSASFAAQIQSDNVEEYPLLTTNFWREPDADNRLNSTSIGTYSWPGSDSTNHFFNMQEMFNVSKIQVPSTVANTNQSFVARLLAAGQQTNSYDRYTYYRLLAQLGTDSKPESGRMNLNYDNITQTNYQPGATSLANSWDAADFFVNAANRLLTNAGFNFTPLVSVRTNSSVVTSNDPVSPGIQIYPTNFYTPSVHRLLQLAANIYDATTNRPVSGVTNGLGFPTVFRPVFQAIPASGNTPRRIFIVGYREEYNTQLLDTTMVWHDLAGTSLKSESERVGALDMFYGIPVIVGAKKGWPNFNQMSMLTTMQFARKVQVVRDSSSRRLIQTNVMYVIQLTNTAGVDAWYSYTNNYTDNKGFPRALGLIAMFDNSLWFTTNATTNLVGGGWVCFTNWYSITNGVTNSANTWLGQIDLTLTPQLTSTFRVPFFGDFYTNGLQFYAATNGFNLQSSSTTSNSYDYTVPFTTEHWWFNQRTKLRFVMVDVTANRFVDYVNLDSFLDPTQPMMDLITNLVKTPLAANAAYKVDESSMDGEWYPQIATNNGGYSFGVLNQLEVSQDYNPSADSLWGNNLKVIYTLANNPRDEATDFNQWITQGYPTNVYTYQAPYTPVRTLRIYTHWQANDPLVHYTIPDLTGRFAGISNRFLIDDRQGWWPGIGGTNNGVNDNFHPWGGRPGSATENWAASIVFKDPVNLKAPDRASVLVYGRSDDWDFPTNILPNIGWLGRVHRGTPWQTVYLKPFTPGNATNESVDLQNWMAWCGNTTVVTNQGQINPSISYPQVAITTNAVRYCDAYFSQPQNDRFILDLFTTSLNDNSTRGRLSVNDTNLAAWSAVLSGVSVLTNQSSGVFSNMFISPAGIYDPFAGANNLPALVKIVNGISRTRATFPNGTFHRLGDVLATPELTTFSPFYNTNNYSLISDAACERIPQQILGLLQCAPYPRYVIYSYGQTLKPAEHSLVTGGSLMGLCTNYQVTAETATRTVIHFEPTWTNFPAGLEVHPVIESSTPLPPD